MVTTRRGVDATPSTKATPGGKAASSRKSAAKATPASRGRAQGTSRDAGRSGRKVGGASSRKKVPAAVEEEDEEEEGEEEEMQPMDLNEMLEEAVAGGSGSEGGGEEEESSSDEDEDEDEDDAAGDGDLAAHMAAAMAARLAPKAAPLRRSIAPDAPATKDVTVEAMAEAERRAALRWEPDTGLPAPAGADVGLWDVARRAAQGAAPGPAAERALAAGGGRKGGKNREPVGGDEAAVERAMTAARAGMARSLYVQDARQMAKEAKKNKPDTLGAKWHGMVAPKMTPELKRDLRLLKLRGAADPKRFYKSADTGKLPKYFAVGTVVEGAQDFYSGRLSKKQRKSTITDELLSDDVVRQYRKRRVAKIHMEKDQQHRVRKKAHRSDNLEYTARRNGKSKH